MSTYTVIWEYRGGTHIKQVTARTPELALVAWSQALTSGEISGIGTKRLASLAKEIAEGTEGLYAPAALTGLTNAWCAGMLYGGLINIVKTDTSP